MHIFNIGIFLKDNIIYFWSCGSTFFSLKTSGVTIRNFGLSDSDIHNYFYGLPNHRALLSPAARAFFLLLSLSEILGLFWHQTQHGSQSSSMNNILVVSKQSNNIIISIRFFSGAKRPLQITLSVRSYIFSDHWYKMRSISISHTFRHSLV